MVESHNFFTDGSKSHDEEQARFGVYCEQLDIQVVGALPRHASVFHCELTAIFVALRLIQKHFIKAVVIVCDSKSVLIALNSSTNLDNNLLWETRGVARDLECQGSKIQFVWSRSHRGITGNDKADWLAKRGRGMDVSEVKLHYRNFSKKINFEEWQSWWERTSRCKGRAYFNIQERVSLKAWYDGFPWISRKFFVTFNLLRIGHCAVAKHLCRIGARESPLCEVCNVEEDVNHIFLGCRKYILETNRLLMELVKMLYFPPFSISSLLATNNIHVYLILYKFINQSILYYSHACIVFC